MHRVKRKLVPFMVLFFVPEPRVPRPSERAVRVRRSGHSRQPEVHHRSVAHESGEGTTCSRSDTSSKCRRGSALRLVASDWLNCQVLH